MSHPVGTIYLLHFDKPYKHAKHYMGWTQDLEQRLAAHRKGDGARIMAVIAEAKIQFQLARVWLNATKDTERRFKRWNGASRLCPLCKQQAKAGDAF